MADMNGDRRLEPNDFNNIQTLLTRTGIAGEWVSKGQTVQLGGLKGAYILWMRFNRSISIDIKRLGTDTLLPGHYMYVGSAYGSGGLAARLKRHFAHQKVIHWHIDRLTTKATQLGAFAVSDGNECQLAKALLTSGRFGMALAGFGSSDCKTCQSHLLVFKESASP